MKNKINLPHKVCGMSCMVNGLEDLYEWKTGLRLPDWLLFFGSGMAEFTYLKQSGADVPRRVLWGTRAKEQYRRLAEVMGFTWKVLEGRSFKFTLSEVIHSIDAGHPPISGGIDMFYLPYFEKIYQRFHIPIHHFLFVGYDLEKEVVYIQDCDRPEPEALSFAELENAWKTQVPGLYRPNTVYFFDFLEEQPNPEDLSHRLILNKANFMLNPPAALFGIKGMRKLATEINGWEKELDKNELEASLRWLVEYTGNPPSLPEKLVGYPSPGNHQAGRDGFARLLKNLNIIKEEDELNRAADCFFSSGAEISRMTDYLTGVLLGEREKLQDAVKSINLIAELEEAGYRILHKTLR